MIYFRVNICWIVEKWLNNTRKLIKKKILYNKFIVLILQIKGPLELKRSIQSYIKKRDKVMINIANIPINSFWNSSKDSMKRSYIWSKKNRRSFLISKVTALWTKWDVGLLRTIKKLMKIKSKINPMYSQVEMSLYLHK